MAMESSRKTQDCFYIQKLLNCIGDEPVYMNQLFEKYIILYLVLSVISVYLIRPTYVV
jgi:hypothetical protein